LVFNSLCLIRDLIFIGNNSGMIAYFEKDDKEATTTRIFTKHENRGGSFRSRRVRMNPSSLIGSPNQIACKLSKLQSFHSSDTTLSNDSYITSSWEGLYVQDRGKYTHYFTQR
jgi:hypothetical protein